jgi:2-oxo-4-hydroxy-4-carboxy-5-ureidoimidazoline decarboxylase
MAKLSLAALDALDRDGFVAALGHVVEDSPWVVAAVADERPFSAKADLAAAFGRALRRASDERRLAVLRAHPDLGAKLEALTGASRAEQHGAGLAGLREADRQRFLELNTAYRAKFGFPFLFAVKGATPAQILAAFEARLPNDAATEHEEALRQVERIVAFRLDDLIE